MINKHLADAREATFGKSDESVNAENVKLGVDEKPHPEIRKMPPKHNYIWLGRLRNVNISQNCIDLIHGARTFQYIPYRAGKKNRELEQFEIEKQIKARVIEHSVSEWAPPVRLNPKKDGSLSFCVDYLQLNPMKIKDSYALH